MQRHNGKNRRKDVETKKPCPQRCLCHRGMYADTKKGERAPGERRVSERDGISLEMQCPLLWFLVLVFIAFLYNYRFLRDLSFQY